VVDDFEAATDHWYANAEEGSTVECGPETGMAHGGTGSLRIGYNIVADGWGDCGRSFEGARDWSGGTGLSLWLRADEAEWITLMLFSGDPDGPTPFEVDLEIAAEGAGDWVRFVFPWAEFARAEWTDEGGLATIDPARMMGYGFSIGAGEGALWVDDVQLVTGEGQPPGPVTAPTTAPVASGEGEEPGGGICSGTMALPLGVLGVLWVVRRRSRWVGRVGN
jgi:uncharacterized protein (TIGR03382 family)